MLHTRLLVFLFFCVISFCQGQAIHDDSHAAQLSEYRIKAADFRARNLNRFGLYQLQQYDNTLDLLYARERADTLDAIRSSLEKSGAAIQGEFNALKNKKDTYLANKISFDNSYNQLLSKAAIIILVLLGAFIIVLFIWQKRLSRELHETSLFDVKLKNAVSLAGSGDRLINKARENLPVLHKMKDHIKEITRQSEQFQHNITAETKNGAWKDMMMITKKVNQQVLAEEGKNAAIVEFAQNTSEEKVTADINQICMNYFELVKEGYKKDEDGVPVSVTTDLEKNLPQVKVVPAAIGHLLLHVLTNAMQSVQAKARKNVKGYEPKVALSTRILPRFLQIRIHDNGDGIEDKYQSRIRDPFFTLKNEEDAGLGLYISKLIMKNHQGELKIESDRNRGTDVYLKFFIN